MKDLPQKFVERMKKILGDEYAKYEQAMTLSPIRGFRVNTDKISLKDFEKINPFKTKKIPYVENGFYFDYDKIGSHPFHHAGMIYVQEPGAMAPAECIEIQSDWKILDMCAAPGGKSTQLKNKLGENGVLVSNEIISSRCKILTGNIERLGLTNTVTTCMDTSKIAKVFPDTFDLIMVDAPCSGEGMFRKDDTAIDEWSEDNVIKCAKRQEEILENAVIALKNNGYIIYATCTFSLEENEMIIDKFLQNHPEFEIAPVKKIVHDCTVDGISFDGCKTENIKLTRRFYPHNSPGEGQFMAVLHNMNEALHSSFSKQNIKHNIDKSLYDFLDDTLIRYDRDNVRTYGDKPIYFTPDFTVPNKTAFSCGITIGEIKKGYILPHHHFFSAMGKNFKRKIELSVNSEELNKYLHGEEFETECENGWSVVTLNGCSIGGVKVVNGKAKNHYPKGLRTKF